MVAEQLILPNTPAMSPLLFCPCCVSGLNPPAIAINPPTLPDSVFFHLPLFVCFNAESVAEYSPGQAWPFGRRPALGCPDRKHHAPTGQPKWGRAPKDKGGGMPAVQKAPRRPSSYRRRPAGLVFFPARQFRLPLQGKFYWRLIPRADLALWAAACPGLYSDVPLGQQR